MQEIDIMRNPLAAMTAASFAPDGRFTLNFASVKEARTWMQRFVWKRERQKKELRKEARLIGAKRVMGKGDMERYEECADQILKLDEFHASRDGTTVTIMSFRINTGLVSTSPIPAEA